MYGSAKAEENRQAFFSLTVRQTTKHPRKRVQVGVQFPLEWDEGPRGEYVRSTSKGSQRRLPVEGLRK